MCRKSNAKVKARKSILFIKGSFEVKRKSKHLINIMITFYFNSLCFTVLRSSNLSHSIVTSRSLYISSNTGTYYFSFVLKGSCKPWVNWHAMTSNYNPNLSVSISHKFNKIPKNIISKCCLGVSRC